MRRKTQAPQETILIHMLTGHPSHHQFFLGGSNPRLLPRGNSEACDSSKASLFQMRQRPKDILGRKQSFNEYLRSVRRKARFKCESGATCEFRAIGTRTIPRIKAGYPDLPRLKVCNGCYKKLELSYPLLAFNPTGNVLG